MEVYSLTASHGQSIVRFQDFVREVEGRGRSRRKKKEKEQEPIVSAQTTIDLALLIIHGRWRETQAQYIL